MHNSHLHTPPRPWNISSNKVSRTHCSKATTRHFSHANECNVFRCHTESRTTRAHTHKKSYECAHVTYLQRVYRTWNARPSCSTKACCSTTTSKLWRHKMPFRLFSKLFLFNSIPNKLCLPLNRFTVRMRTTSLSTNWFSSVQSRWTCTHEALCITASVEWLTFPLQDAIINVYNKFLRTMRLCSSAPSKSSP